MQGAGQEPSGLSAAAHGGLPRELPESGVKEQEAGLWLSELSQKRPEKWLDSSPHKLLTLFLLEKKPIRRTQSEQSNLRVQPRVFRQTIFVKRQIFNKEPLDTI